MQSRDNQVVILALMLALAPAGFAGEPAEPDAIVVGAGLSGLAAALEIARGGGRVTVVDRASVFGGHAVMAMGDVCLVGTPAQEARGIRDTPELAVADIMRWGKSSSPEWVRLYAEKSREEIHDWLVAMGVEFDQVLKGQGTENSVPRVHRPKGRGIGLVGPVFQECLKHPGINFLWNSQVDRLLVQEGRVRGVAVTDVRTGVTREQRAGSVILATGGFQSNLDMVREYWGKDLPFPARFLAGSGINSTGEGHQLAASSGAALVAMERQMNLASGIPDPRYKGGNRGLNARPYGSIWVNATGRRFAAEFEDPAGELPVLLRQPGATFWAIFDEGTKRGFLVSGSDWGSFAQIERLILANPALTKTASTVGELATAAGLPVAALEATVQRYNEMVDAGHDADFGRWAVGRVPRSPPRKFGQPPFYAVQFFPLTRKSMGGVSIDLSCRVLAADGSIIPGLYAVGELTGSALINGEQGISGMFLGPCILTGRVAGRAVLATTAPRPAAAKTAAVPVLPLLRPTKADTPACLACHDLPSLVKQERTGYWHFQGVHRAVIARGLDCADCHGDIPVVVHPQTHVIKLPSLSQSCSKCHVAAAEQ
jgi:predicted oxidoreductase